MHITDIVWLVLLLFFLAVEASTATVVSLWFAAGALGAMIVSLCGGQLPLQGVVFVVVSGVTLVLLRPLIKKIIHPRLSKTNVDSVIGSTGFVLETIDNSAFSGKVKLGAMEWTARSADNTVIEKGVQVKVTRIEGVKVFVTPVEASVCTK